ncbi:MAG: LEA type 2 family protein [Sediminibacterium sp.]|jgi:LEA14-like dessication related protein
MKQFNYGLLFLMIFLFACSEPQSFEFKGLQDIQLEKLTMGKNKINANIKYYNPNPFSLVLKQIDCKVLLNNGNFTVFKLDTNFTIPANKEFLIPAKLEFQMSDLVKNSMELLLNKPVKLNITGNATLSKGIFTKTVPIAYETTQKLNLGAALSGMK